VNPVLRLLTRIFGIGALVAGGLAIAVAALATAILLGPLLFWLAWNVLDFGSAIGLPGSVSGRSCWQRCSSWSAGFPSS
jgi:hypothetical protein